MSRFGKLFLSTTCTGLGIFIGTYCERNGNFFYRSKEKLGESLKVDGMFKDDCVTASPLSESLKSYLPVSTVYASSRVGIKPQSPNRLQEILTFGVPQFDPLRTFENHVVLYDRRNKVPHWVFEHITKEHVDKNDNINRNACDFSEDQFVHPFFRSTNADYKRSGYDRGHMAAASNHRHSQKAMNDTFCLSNIAPQVGKGFNQGVWNDLEKYTRALARKYINVYVCTGPLYLPSKEAGKLYVKYEVIGKNHVSVPTHFFKVIVMENDKGEFEMNSFLIPNQFFPEKTPLKTFLVPIQTIESAAGFILFEGVPKSRLKTINGKKV